VSAVLTWSGDDLLQIQFEFKKTGFAHRKWPLCRGWYHITPRPRDPMSANYGPSPEPIELGP